MSTRRTNPSHRPARSPLASLGRARVRRRHWPDKPLRIIVPFPPGGTSDVIARLISKPLGDALSSNVVVENKTGANGAIGAAAVAQATDEHTMLLSDMSSLAINAVVTKELPYKPSELQGATMLAYSPHLLCHAPVDAGINIKRAGRAVEEEADQHRVVGHRSRPTTSAWSRSRWPPA